jgi:hypothetical protein
VYLASAFSRVFAVLPGRRINNLRVFNRAFSSIPTASTNHPTFAGLDTSNMRRIDLHAFSYLMTPVIHRLHETDPGS